MASRTRLQTANREKIASNHRVKECKVDESKQDSHLGYCRCGGSCRRGCGHAARGALETWVDHHPRRGHSQRRGHSKRTSNCRHRGHGIGWCNKLNDAIRLLRVLQTYISGETVNLSFRHYDYRPLDLKLQISLPSNLKGLYIAALEPITQVADSGGPFSVVSNIRIRYTVNLQAQANIGTAVKTFQVVNQGNVPCQDQYPCSPDGLWKASTGSATMDAGPNSEFRNVRASCFAGPCPFTRIDSSGFAH